MKYKHTPGPWFLQKAFGTIYSFYGETSGTTTAVASTLRKQLKNKEIEEPANAKLITAAPILLQELRNLIDAVMKTEAALKLSKELFNAEQAFKQATE